MSPERTAGPLAADREGLERLAAAWDAEGRRSGSFATRPNLVLADAVDSTQRWARTLLDAALAEDEEPEPFLCSAVLQTAGRGRERRSWTSPGGGVYATLVFRAESSESLGSIPARVGVALAGVANAILGGRCRLKWPNDLVVGGRKLGGILVDAVSVVGGGPWVLVGAGINHSPKGLGEATDVATSLALETRLELPFFEAFFAATLAALWEGAREPTGEDWLEAYRELSAHAPGDAIRTRLGDAVIEGRFVGFDERGFLRLETEAGERVVRSGEVFAW